MPIQETIDKVSRCISRSPRDLSRWAFGGSIAIVAPKGGDATKDEHVGGHEPYLLVFKIESGKLLVNGEVIRYIEYDFKYGVLRLYTGDIEPSGEEKERGLTTVRIKFTIYEENNHDNYGPYVLRHVFEAISSSFKATLKIEL